CPGSFSGTTGRPAIHPARRQLRACNAPALHSLDAARQAAPGNIAPPSQVAFRPPLVETRPAITPALDRSYISPSAAAPLRRKPPAARRGASFCSIQSSQETVGYWMAANFFAQNVFPAPDMPTSASRRGLSCFVSMILSEWLP